jgi:hypothetical protein
MIYIVSHEQFVILFLLAQVKVASSFSHLHLMKNQIMQDVMVLW